MTAETTETTPIIPNQASTLSEWLDYMQQIHVSAIDMGLSRVLPVAEQLGITQSAKKDAYVFTVAGTNGKGSTTAVISEICQQAGYKTALYQSPHLIDFNERVRINGHAVGDQVLVDAFVQVELARLACELTLSFFEMTTLAAMLIFAQAQCDVWVLEVGLGGRLDVVNIIDPDLAVITNIGIDHIDWLGDTLEKIGAEKAGILRAGSTLVYGEADMPTSVQDIIDKLQVNCYQVGKDFDCLGNNQKSSIEKGTHDFWQFSCAAITMQLPIPKLCVINAANAIAAVLASSIWVNQDHIEQALLTVKLAGRFDVRVLHNRLWLFDVAHNVEGMAFLLPSVIKFWQQHCAQYIKKNDSISKMSTMQDKDKNTLLPKLHIVFSMLTDKAIDAVTALLLKGLLNAKPVPTIQWHIAKIDHPRAAQSQQLAKAIERSEKTAIINEYKSLNCCARQVVEISHQNDLILVCGSFHTIGEVMQGLGVKLGEGL